MASASPPNASAELRRSLERTESRESGSAPVLQFGIPEMDGRLPGGGLHLGHLHEVIEAGAAAEYAGLATLVMAGIVARIPGPVLWCLRGRDLFAPALARIGLHPDRVNYCETWKDREVFPAMEESFRCKGLAGVVGEVTQVSLTASRLLQLCAAESGVSAFIIRRWHNVREKELAGEPNAAATRWRVSPHPSPPTRFDEMKRQHWRVELLRVSDGEPFEWIVEGCNAKGRLALPAEMVDGPAAAGEQRISRAG